MKKQGYPLKLFLSVFFVLAFLSLSPERACASQEETIGVVPDLLQGQDSMLSGTALGYAVADAVLDAAGTDFAIVNGGSLAQNLSGGSVTWNDIYNVFYQDDEIGVTEITPSQLKELLEIAVSSIVIKEGDAVDKEASESDGFIQPGGFSYKYDVSAPAGDRVLEITVISSGESLDLSDDLTTYTLAASKTMLSGGYSFPALSYKLLSVSVAEALGQAVAEGTLTEQGEDRVIQIGASDSRLIDALPAGVIPLLAVFFGVFRYRRRKMTSDGSDQDQYNCKRYRSVYYKN